MVLTANSCSGIAFLTERPSTYKGDTKGRLVIGTFALPNEGAAFTDSPQTPLAKFASTWGISYGRRNHAQLINSISPSCYGLPIFAFHA